MNIKIVKGTNQIGGAITIIESKEAKIVIDFGCDLPDEEKVPVIPEIKGLTYGDSLYDAVFITHSHSDHIGLINKITQDIPIYVEEKSKRIYDLTNAFTSKDLEEIKTNTFNFNTPINIKDLKITPYRTDHSAYNSAMFLIETEGKKVLHMGDFRTSGRTSSSFEKTLKKIGKVNCLITEGTCFSREKVKNIDEWRLEIDATENFKNYNQVFILQSSTNIDRLVSFYKASTRTGKNFIEDLFTATIAMPLNMTIPKPGEFSNVSVWIPMKYNLKSREFKEKYIKPMEQYQNSYVFHNDYTMLVKTSMLDDIKMLKEKRHITKSCLIYSMWEGYKKQKAMQDFLREIENLGIEIITLHTSGHADIETMKWLDETLKPDNVIPIHTTKKEVAKEVFKNVKILNDNEELKI